MAKTKEEKVTQALVALYDTEEAAPRYGIHLPENGHPSGRKGFLPALLTQLPNAVFAELAPAKPETGLTEPQRQLRVITNVDTGEQTFDHSMWNTGTALYLLSDGVGTDVWLTGQHRFYYALTPKGVYTFDARRLTQDLVRNTLPALIAAVPPIFFTPWEKEYFAQRAEIIEANEAV